MERIMTDLLTYLKEQNAEKMAWMAEGEGRWTGLFTEDLAHWAEYDVYTVEDFERYMNVQTYSDWFKSVMGYRPRHDTSEWTAEKWDAEFKWLAEEGEEQMKREAAAEAAALAEFEAEIAKCMELGAADRETALRWMTQEDDEGFYSRQCVEHWVYMRGLLFTEYGKKLVEELMGIVKFKEYV